MCVPDVGGRWPLAPTAVRVMVVYRPRPYGSSAFRRRSRARPFLCLPFRLLLLYCQDFPRVRPYPSHSVLGLHLDLLSRRLCPGRGPGAGTGLILSLATVLEILRLTRLRSYSVAAVFLGCPLAVGALDARPACPAQLICHYSPRPVTEVPVVTRSSIPLFCVATQALRSVSRVHAETRSSSACPVQNRAPTAASRWLALSVAFLLDRVRCYPRADTYAHLRHSIQTLLASSALPRRQQPG